VSQSISAAVQAAQPGAYIRLSPGEFVESIVIDRPVTIVAEAAGQTIIRNPPGAPALKLAADVVLYGLTLRDSGSSQDNAVEIVNGRATIDNCTFAMSNSSALSAKGAGVEAIVRTCQVANSGTAFSFADGARGTLEDCEVASAGLMPLFADGRSNLEMRRCRFTNTRLGGVVVQNGSHVAFEECHWSGNPVEKDLQRVRFRAQLTVNGAKAVLKCCQIMGGSAVGVSIERGGEAELSDTEIADNGRAGLQVMENSVAEVLRCRLRNHGGGGIVVLDGSRLKAAELDVSGSKAAGIAAAGGGSFEVRSGRFSGNLVGAAVLAGGRGLLENCDLTGNVQGPISVAEGCPLQCIGTRLQ
jgi:Right handed beta helix region